jgi:hypothetical protein
MKATRQLIAVLFAALSFSAVAQLIPFTPVATTNTAVTSTAATLTLPTAITGVNRQVVLSLVGTQNAFIVCDGTNSASPTTATTSNGMPMLANTQIVISLNASVRSCSVIAAASGSTLYATSGFGG